VEFFSGLEANGLSGGDGDLSAGPWIAPDACFPGTDAKNAEAAEFDAVACGKGLFEAFKDRIDRSFRLGAWQSRTLDDLVDDILFDQSVAPLLMR
jgi:hypothetical protein